MGAEVHCKAFLPGYYSMMDLNMDGSNGGWPFYHDDRTLKGGQPYNVFLPRPTMDGCLGYEKELLRQTIMKHESTFRNQLHELHRLYKIQQHLMKEIRKQEQHKSKAETLQSSLFSSCIPCEDAKRTWHTRNLSLADSACAFEYIGNEAQLEEKVSGVPGMENHPLNRDCQANGERGILSSPRSGVTSGCNGDAVRSSFQLKKTQDLVDLNEPVMVKEASASASVELGSITCSGEEFQRQDLSVNSNLGIQCFAKEFSQHYLKRRDGREGLDNLQIEKERNQKLSYNFEAEQAKNDKNSSHKGFCLGDVPNPCKPLQDEPTKAYQISRLFPSDQSKPELHRKRTIFGVEISERVEASCTPSLQPVVSQSNEANSESSSVLSWRKIPSNFCTDMVSVQEHSCSYNSAPRNKSFIAWTQNPGVIGDRFHVNGILRTIPTFSAGVSNENGPCGLQSLSKEMQVHCPSVGYDFSNGISNNNSASEQFARVPLPYVKGSGSIDVKPAMDVAPGNKYKVISPQDSMFTNQQYKQKNPSTELHWLGGMSLGTVESFKPSDDSYQMTLDSLKNHSLQVASKTEIRNGPAQNLVQDFTLTARPSDVGCYMNEASDYLGDQKILGVPIFAKSHVVKDPFSASSPLPSAIDGVNSRKIGLLNNSFCNPKSEEQLGVKSLAVEVRQTDAVASCRHYIDLNLCFIDEETPSAHSCPSIPAKIAAEIDLEAPVVLETEEGIPSRGESMESQIKKPFELSERESGVRHEGSMREAAEAIIAISTSSLHDELLDNATCHSLVASPSDTLRWFAEVISSHKDDISGSTGTLLMGKDGGCHEEFVPEGIDFFEYMTLKLTETKVEEYCCCQPETLEIQNDEKPLPRQPRRGQARRGRQRRDFQRDVLPGLVSLSKHEVVEDLQTIEGLMKASGCIWQSGFAQKNDKKGGGGRGRRRSRGSAPSVTVSAVCTPQIQQSNHKEVGLEEKSLTGWGKRTRRPPRQRCSVANYSHTLK
ncbi:uncharacterized protein LOC131163565 isoform X2 [Malania oleifera]|uniref:uncharacterized protein LOC131163565 isoform X2 n=1 Tax=Malania oleifera TaxID=397392 RepID=UPI0025AE3F2A|nr:uncharacterized protein LOC131163565 isoform X2 [Malania oleifera]